jgi:DNA polymerase III subunit alpha, Gram-positive type
MIATVFDCETTGLIENPARKLDSQPEIISFASVTVALDTEQRSDEYYRIFKPSKPISQQITEITGFTNRDLNDCNPIFHYIDEMINILEKAPILIGQNIRFDQDMIELECKRYARSIRWPKTIDIVQNTIHIKGYRLSLTNLHMELFGHEFDSAHRADVDVLITAKCAIELYKRGML